MAEFDRYQISMLLNQPKPLWLAGRDLSDVDMRRANLARAELSEADLHNANLTEANLSGACLMPN